MGLGGAGGEVGAVTSCLRVLRSLEDCADVSPAQLVTCARLYQLAGRSTQELCEHNAQVARNMGEAKLLMILNCWIHAQ